MTSEDLSQLTNDPTTEVHTQVAEQTHVTADVQASDNATPPINQETAEPQQVDAGKTGEGVDESGKKTYADYQARRQAFLSKPVATETVVESTPQAQQTAQTIDEDEVPLIQDGVLPRNMRVKPATPVDVQAIATYQASKKAGDTRSLVQFIQEQYPTTAPAVAVTETGEVQTQHPTDEPTTVAAVDAKLAALRQEKRDALEAFDHDRVIAIEEEQDALREQRGQMSAQQQEQQSAAQQQAQSETVGYLQEAAEMYPQTLNANDPLIPKAAEVMAGWRASGDPRGSMPAGNLYCYVEAAKQLGVKPSGGAPAQTSSPKPSTPSPVHRAPITNIVASGNATSTQSRAQVDTRTYAERKADLLTRTAA